eukprot:scaffold103024_cov26-Tisochrysis_lutea.AAC.1
MQVRHLGFLKHTLGVKCTTSNYAVLRECGHEPLHLCLLSAESSAPVKIQEFTDDLRLRDVWNTQQQAAATDAVSMP